MLIDTSNLPVFLGAIAVLLIVPGPDFFLITTQAVARGAKSGVACALGIGLAGLVQTALVALGLGKAMETWPVVANVIRLAGAVYLAVLGIGLLRSWWRGRSAGGLAPVAALPERSTRSLFLAGFANNLSNPKSLLFFSVFIPQFVDPALGSASTQIAILGVLLTVIASLYNIAIACAFAQFKRLASGRGMVARNGAGLLGVLFLLLAARLAASRAT
jgi:threonine/homoserine/homoserine lactone efflux protein